MIKGGAKLEAKEISQAVVSRLPRYFRYLGELKDDGIERISSQEAFKADACDRVADTTGF